MQGSCSAIVTPSRRDCRRGAGLAGDNAEAAMFDLVQPWAAGRQFIGFGWEARRDEPARKSTLQHVQQIELGRGECNRAEPGASCCGRA